MTKSFLAMREAYLILIAYAIVVLLSILLFALGSKHLAWYVLLSGFAGAIIVALLKANSVQRGKV